MFIRKFRNDEPGNNADNDPITGGNKGYHGPDPQDDRRIGIDVFARPAADSDSHLFVAGAIQPFHVHKIACAGLKISRCGHDTGQGSFSTAVQGL
jgi:hypothetical protein